MCLINISCLLIVLRSFFFASKLCEGKVGLWVKPTFLLDTSTVSEFYSAKQVSGIILLPRNALHPGSLRFEAHLGPPCLATYFHGVFTNCGTVGSCIVFGPFRPPQESQCCQATQWVCLATLSVKVELDRNLFRTSPKGQNIPLILAITTYKI